MKSTSGRKPGWRERGVSNEDIVAELRELRRSIHKLTRHFAAGVEIMAQELDDLTAQVQTNTDVEASAVVLIKGIAAKLAAAGTDPVKLNALKAELSGSADALAAAVAENTIAAPAP